MLSSKRKGIQSERYIKKRRNRAILLAVLGVVALVGLVVGISYLSRASFFQVKKINVISASTTALVSPADKIQSIAESGLEGSWGGLLSKGNTFLFPGTKISSEIIAAFPRVESVAIHHTGWTTFDTLNVVVTERTPFALACDATEQCFYMDAGGFVYALAPDFSPGVYVRYYLDPTATSSITVGDTFTSPERLAAARQAVDYISKMGIQVVRATILDHNEYKLLIKNIYATSTPVVPVAAIASLASSTATSTAPAISSPVSTIYFNTSAPLEKTLNYFLVFWQSRSNKNFNYIDLRYGNDIVFKMH